MKKALLVGIEYKNSNSRLHGCIDDVAVMKKSLIENFGFQEKDITTLIESQATKNAIENSIRALIAGTTSSDTLLFMFSGHGNQVKTSDITESDKLNEGILSYNNRLIVDDTLKALVDTSPSPVVCVFDCCHSGTILDNSKAIVLSACKDDETAADGKVNGLPTGMFSFSIHKSLKENKYQVSYANLIKNSNIFLTDRKIKQTPQLLCENSVRDQLFLGGGAISNIVYTPTTKPVSWFSTLFKK